MQTIVLPKNPRKKDYFIASMAYIAGKDKDQVNFTMESDEVPCNIRDSDVINSIKESIPSNLAEVITMHLNYNVCDPIICSGESVIDKVKEISNALMVRCSQ